MSLLDPFSSRRRVAARLAALDRSQAVIEFDPTGKVLDANANFLAVMGYALDEVKGRHHSIFVAPDERDSQGYREFWGRLGRGEFMSGPFLRIGKGGKEVWIQASYNPVLDSGGRPVSVVKYAVDITQQKNRLADLEGQRQAIDKAQAVIEFDLNGNILHANDNFLSVMGYTLDEVIGRHHSMFVDAAESETPAYREFWERLGRGEYEAAQYRRIAKGGREVWIQASYNPILDAKGRPYKVVKFATDITESFKGKQLEAAVRESRAVIARAKERDLTGRVSLDGKSGEVAQLCAGVNDLIDIMAGVIASVRQASVRIDEASVHISEDSVKLAERTEANAASLQETAATTEELAASVKHSAGNSRSATMLGEEASQVAARGGAIVGEAIDAMERIEKSSTDISEIIAMIDEIAFQTNLLALNAAVEAARAGDAGRGFAVVASEVRALAKRCSDSANGVKSLIVNSSRQIRSGVKLVQDAGEALREIVDAASRVAATVGEISLATTEQANGIEEMARTVAHMDEMTQQNALLADQSSRVARDLRQDTRALSTLVAAFSLNADAGAGLDLAAPSVPVARSGTAFPLERPRRVANGGWAEF